MNDLLNSLKLVSLTFLICCVIYPLTVLTLAQTIDKNQADGSLVYNQAGDVVGSSLVAQAFTSPRYFWPRPSAVDFNAAAAGGSNLAPSSPDLTSRALEIIRRLSPLDSNRVPADLVTASGSGLDPHISEMGAELQAARVATVRQLPLQAVQEQIRSLAFAPGGRLATNRIVNVLMLNLSLDREIEMTEKTATQRPPE